jgi:hypothetical protein
MGIEKLVVKDKLERPQAKLCVKKTPGSFNTMLTVKKDDANTGIQPVVVS